MAIKTYSYKKNKKLSTHFYSNEFASKSGSKLYSDKILIDTPLISSLEKFFKYGITTIVITSGYRTSTHDKAVGGNGTGAHTKGFAADMVAYIKNEPVPSKYLACLAELIGFSGIGIIDSTAIHVDKRNNSNYYNAHWFGNEQTGEDNISSFFDYYNLSKAKVYGYFEYYKEELYKIKATKKTAIRTSPKDNGKLKKYYEKGKKARVWAEKDGYLKVLSGWIKKKDTERI